MKLVIDMNLSPDWMPLLHKSGFEAVHWSGIGAVNATDSDLMQWARDHESVVFTHDLDFGILLAHSKHGRPSVIQARTQDVSPEHLGPNRLERSASAPRRFGERGASHGRRIQVQSADFANPNN